MDSRRDATAMAQDYVAEEGEQLRVLSYREYVPGNESVSYVWCWFSLRIVTGIICPVLENLDSSLGFL